METFAKILVCFVCMYCVTFHLLPLQICGAKMLQFLFSSGCCKGHTLNTRVCVHFDITELLIVSKVYELAYIISIIVRHKVGIVGDLRLCSPCRIYRCRLCSPCRTVIRLWMYAASC